MTDWDKFQFPNGYNYEILKNSPKVFEVQEDEFYYFNFIQLSHLLTVFEDENERFHHFVPNTPFYCLQHEEFLAHSERYQWRDSDPWKFQEIQARIFREEINRRKGK